MSTHVRTSTSFSFLRIRFGIINLFRFIKSIHSSNIENSLTGSYIKNNQNTFSHLALAKLKALFLLTRKRAGCFAFIVFWISC